MTVPYDQSRVLRVPGMVQTGAADLLFDGDEDGQSVPRLVLEALLAVRRRACSPCCLPRRFRRLTWTGPARGVETTDCHQCTRDVRGAVASRVLLIGGTTALAGFETRLLSTLHTLASGETRYSALSALVQRMGLRSSPFAHGARAWTGGMSGGRGGRGGGRRTAGCRRRESVRLTAPVGVWAAGLGGDVTWPASLGGVLRARGYEVTREAFVQDPTSVPDWSTQAYVEPGVLEAADGERW